MKIKTKSLMLYSVFFLMTAIFSNCKKEEILLSEINPVKNSEQLETTTESEKDSVQNQNEDPLDTAEPDSAVNTEKDSIVPPQAEPPRLEPEQTLPPIGAHAYSIEKALPEGYVKDGSVDYTSYIQKAVNNYTELVFPGFPLLVNDAGIKIPSNRIIHFMAGSEIRLKASSKANYDIFRIENAVNVTLNNPYIIGDRYHHIGTKGEWGNGIGIYSSKNITVNEAKVYNCWGDGIYIGTSNNVANEEIKLYKPYCKSNRRNGISVISVKGLQIIEPYTGYTDGTAPYCGIDIEPNTSHDKLENIVISNPVTEHNKGNGIQIGLTKMYAHSTKNISINISGHSDVGSFYAFKVSNTHPGTHAYLEGDIKIDSPVWNYSQDRPLWMSQTDPKLNVYISKPKVTAESGTTVGKLSTIEKQLKFGLKKISIPYILSL